MCRNNKLAPYIDVTRSRTARSGVLSNLDTNSENTLKIAL